MEADNVRIQNNLDNNKYANDKAKTAAKNKIARQQASINALRGGQDATQQVDTTATRDGAQILSGPEAGGAPAGLTPDGRPGVVDTTSVVSPIEDGAGAQQSALDAAAEQARLAEEQRLATEAQAQAQAQAQAAEQARLAEEQR